MAEELRKTDPNLKENKIVLLTVLNPIYSLNVDVIHRICKSNGKVMKPKLSSILGSDGHLHLLVRTPYFNENLFS